jgi:hypothetical protein
LVVVLIDDARSFRDGRDCLAAQSSAAGVDLLLALRASAQPIDELWLDHDLIGEDRIWPVVRLLEDEALVGRRWSISTIKVHASSPGRAHEMVLSLRRAGYEVERVTDPHVFIHRSPDVSSATACLAGEGLAESLE